MSNCFSCFTLYERRKVHNKKGECESGESGDSPDVGEKGPSLLPRIEKPLKVSIDTDFNKEVGDNNIQAQTFNFRELASATKNFRQETLLGEGGFGRVYKGHLHKIGKAVAVKQLDRNGMQGNKEFLVEVLMLSNLHHQNLVNLIGYCADGDQRLLVYEFMPLGSLEDHLLDLQPEDTPLNWHTRLKIALGAAKGLEYLHDTASPPIIYRDLKSSNILLDEEYNAKLSDFGLAKLGPLGEKTHVSSRVMGTYGYCAPEYQRTGHLTLKSDIYSFGVVLLEIITGRRAIDPTKPIDEQNLVSWAEPYFREPSKFPLLADPLLQENYPVKSLNQIVAIAAMCLQDEASVRPLISDVVTALSFLGMAPDQGPRPPHPTPLPEPAPTPYSTKPPEPILDLDRPQLAPVLIPPQPAPPPTYDVVPIGQGSPIVQLSASPRAPSPPLSPVLSSTLAPVSPPAHVQNSPKASSPNLVLAPVLAPISPIAQVQDSPQAPSMVLDKASSPQFPSSPQSPSLVLSKALSMVQFPSSPQASSPIMDQALASPLDEVSASPLAMDPGPMINVHKETYTMGSDSSDDDGDKYDSESDDNILGLTSEDEDCEEEVENAVEWAPTSRNEQQRFLVTTDA